MTIASDLLSAQPLRCVLRAHGLRMGLLGLTCLTPGYAYAQTLPTGGSYVAGQGVISSAGSTTTIVQSSQQGIINWQGFSIGSGNSVNFNNGNGATLNRVTGAEQSAILGHLNATGSVYLINPNGVVVSSSGKIVTGGSFVASTRDVSNSQFMQGGTLVFNGSSAGAVTNDGKIISKNGDVVLIGAVVTNNGSLHAKNGTAALVAGNQVVLSDAKGPAGVYVAPDASVHGDVTNKGQIRAAAAELAAAGGNVYALAGNHQGLISATGAKNTAGQVWLTAANGAVTVDNSTVSATSADGAGGEVIANGQTVTVGAGATLAANATQAGKAGGKVLVGVSAPGGVNLAQATTIASGATLTATGKGTGAGGDIETSGHTLTVGAANVVAGPGGSWLLDPVDLNVGSAAASAIDTSLNSGTGVTLTTSATTAAGPGSSASGVGNININAPISWSTNVALSLSAYNSVNVNAAITATGAGVLNITTNTQNATANPGTLNFNAGSIDFTTPSEGKLNINGTAYTLVWGVSGLQGLNNATTGHYALANNVAAGSTPINAALIGNFGADFNGLGNSLSGLTINAKGINNVGLFGTLALGGTIENMNIVGANITGSSSVGGLVGSNTGTITNSSASGAVSGSSNLGGLVGQNKGTITNSSASGTVGPAPGISGGTVGGLVGSNMGGTIKSSYATGAASGKSNIGGLSGNNQSGGTIADSYATGAVSGQGNVGGLVGNSFGSTITDAYATGAVTGSGSNIGGLVGRSSGSTITDGYYDTNTTGISASANPISGVTGLTTMQWLTSGPTVAGSQYSFQNAGAWVSGSPYPVLAALPYIIITGAETQVAGSSTVTVSGQWSAVDQNGNPAGNLVNVGGNGITWISATPTGAGGPQYFLGGSGASAAGYQVTYRGAITLINPTPTPTPQAVAAASAPAIWAALNTNGLSPVLLLPSSPSSTSSQGELIGHYLLKVSGVDESPLDKGAL